MHCSINFAPWLQIAILCGELPCVAGYPDPMPHPMITSPPQLEKRSGDLIGYYFENSSYSPFFCNGAVSLTQSDYYLACADPKSPSTSLEKSCPTSTQFDFCTGTDKCVALRVLPSKGSIITYTMVGCLNGGDIPDSTVYQALPSSTVPMTTSTTCCTPPIPPIPSRNLAWIAGIVIGGLVGLVAIGVLVWFIMRRRKQRVEEPVASSQAFTSTAPKEPVSPSLQSTFYSPTYPSMSSPVQASSPAYPSMPPPVQASSPTYPPMSSPIQASSPPNFSPPPQFAPPFQSQWQSPAQEMSAQQSPNPPAELGTTPASFPATGGWKN